MSTMSDKGDGSITWRHLLSPLCVGYDSDGVFVEILACYHTRFPIVTDVLYFSSPRLTHSGHPTHLLPKIAPRHSHWYLPHLLVIEFSLGCRATRTDNHDPGASNRLYYCINATPKNLLQKGSLMWNLLLLIYNHINKYKSAKLWGHLSRTLKHQL